MEENERAFTPEVREKLIGLNPISHEVGVPATPPVYQERGIPKEFHPVFHQRSLTHAEQIAFDSKNQAGGSAMMEAMEAVAHQTTVRIENYWDIGKGQLIQVPMNGKGIDPEWFHALPTKIKVWLFQRAFRLSGLTKEEKEGLEFSPPSTPG